MTFGLLNNTMYYYHDNPVRAGMVKKPEEWPYSGYRFHILGERDGLLGKVLDPLSEKDPLKLDESIQRYLITVLKNKKQPFIGSLEFRLKMRHK